MSRYCLYIFLSVAGLLLFHNGKAQVVEQVVGAAGGSSKAIVGYTIDFTLGEVVIATAGSDLSCTEGFHQPLVARNLPDSNLTAASWYIKIFPNPVHDELKIHAYMDRAGGIDFRLVDIQGRVLVVRQLSFLQGYNDAVLNVGSLARGIYVLYMSDAVHGGHRAVKLLKE